MKTLFAFTLSTLFLTLGCKKEEAPVAAPATNSNGSSSGYLFSAMKAEQSMENKVDTTSLNTAVELFNAQEGRYPKDLNELVEKKYLGKLPTPPAGMKLNYDSTSGKVELVKP